MAEESGPRPISQTLELMSLFQRFGKTFLGLLLIEIGWTAVLVLATKLTDSEHGAPSIGQVSFIRLWIYGAVILAVFWGFYSRLIYVIMSPIMLMLKFASNIIFTLVAVFLVILDNAILNHIVRPIREALIQRQLKLDKADWIGKNAKSQSSPEANESYETWVSKEKEIIAKRYISERYTSKSSLASLDANPAYADALRNYAERAWKNNAANKVFLKENSLERLVQVIGKNFLTPLHTGVVVGVALLVRYSRDGQDSISDGMPLQQLGDAITSARARLSQLSGIAYVALRPLPSLFRIETLGRARFARFFFQLDALIWGRYTNEQQQLAQVHIVTPGAIRLENDDVCYRYHRAIFPWVIDDTFFDDISSFIVAVDNPVETHIVMCIGLLKALIGRERGRKKFLGSWDEYRTSLGDARRILIHLAFDVLPLVCAADVAPGILPRAPEVLADTISRWVGYQIGTSSRSEEEDKWIEQEKELFVPQLHTLVGRCARWTPQNAAHFYRLGALSCVMGEPENALVEFRHAAILERNNQRVRPFRAANEAKATLRGTPDHFALACFAAHAACAIYTGGGHLIQEHMEEFDLKIMYGDRPAIALVQKMVAETNNLSPWMLPQIPAA
jgi:hypothetical protein